MTEALPKIAVWKFSSCDGCQLSLLDCEDELLGILGRIEIAYFPEATRAEIDGPYDVSLVEGSITTPEEAERIKEIREKSGLVVAIGACATAGGIQALRNWADVDEFASAVYAHPEFLETLETSTPHSDHVKVDLELQGCPISKTQLVDTLLAVLAGRRPNVPTDSVCTECKRRQTPCVQVLGIPCMGPVTQAGCGAICPAYGRGCYGCYGPKENPNTVSLTGWWSTRMGVSEPATLRAFRTFSGYKPGFREESARHG
jgi:coenzyme F420-reducing hydrogenase gamma subunit